MSRHTDYYRTPRGRANRLLQAAKQRANRYGIECTITADWIEEQIVAGVCPETGLEFDLTPGSMRAPSLDRKVNTYGYVPINCQIVVAAYNQCKGTWGKGAVEALAYAYLRHRGVNTFN